MKLLERDRECTALVGFLEEVVSGDGGLAVLAAPSGAGKSALLRWLTERCAADGIAVLSARATELGATVAFGVARRLLTPRVDADPSLIASGWARRSRPLFGATRRGPGVGAPIVEGLAEVVATLCAREGPQVVIVDDVQWADPASLAFLAELADRRHEVGAGVAIAINTGEPASDPGGLDHLRTRAPASTIVPGPLSRAAIGALARGRIPGCEEAFVNRITEATSGNPLLVTEMIEAAATHNGNPLAVPEGLATLVAHRMERVPAAGRALADALAVLGEAPLRRAAALALLDDATADAAADVLLARQIVVLDPELRFAHPILGEALLAGVAPFALAARHRRAAELLSAEGVDEERVAAHLARSRARGDPWTSRLLARAAQTALERGDPGGAVALLERAAAEPPPDPDRAALDLQLARARAAAGRPEAIAGFTRALAHLRDPTRRAETWHRLSRMLYARGDRSQAADAAAQGRAELPVDHPLRERLLAVELGAGSLIPERAAAVAARTEALARDDPPRDPALLAHVIVHSSWRGIHVSRLPSLARAAVAEDPLVDPDSGGFALTHVAGALNMIDATPLAVELLDAGLARAEALGDPLAEASLRCCRAWAQIYRGELALALADLDAVVAASRLGWPAAEALAGPALAIVCLELGDLDGARTALARTPEAELSPGAGWSEGMIAVAAGDQRGALECFERAGAEIEGVLGADNPGVLPWRASAALAAGALGERRRAGELLAPALARAEELGIARALGIAERAAGFVEDDLTRLERSVAVLETSPARLELARSLLYLGAGYRRHRHPRDARAPLARAHQLAWECGATELAARVGRELRAAGARPRTRPLVGVRALTASERNVAELAAAGLTTRRIAAELFVTPKTVEGHLTRIFRKLSIDSRTELAAKLGL